LIPLSADDRTRLLLAVGSGVLLFAVFLGLLLLPFLIWRIRVRRRGYPGLVSYLREVPWTNEQKLDAVELTLKGLVICILGLLIPPIILVGLVPLYYGARKLGALMLGIPGAKEAGQHGISE
jgi:hypothetical protein